MKSFVNILEKINWLKVIVVVAAFVIVIMILKEVKKVLAPSEVRDYERDVKRKNLSYPLWQYQTFADTIYQAAKGVGTDEEAIYRVLQQLKTKDDWLQLVSVYATDKDGFTLPARLIYELDSSEQKKVNSILSKIGVMI